MNGLIVFNSANDVAYQNLNADLTDKICHIAITQRLMPEGSGSALDSNVLLQIFSPIISSQRIMHCQFDNAYASFQCEQGFNLVFGELLGFTFLKIGQLGIEQLQRQLGVAITLTRYCYGANLFGSQAGAMQQELLTECLNCYETQLCKEEQAYLLEALPKLIINAELKRTVHVTLDASLEQLRQAGGQQRAHALLLVSHKLVALNSTRLALPLAPADLLFLAILARAVQAQKSQRAVAVFLQGVSHDVNSGCVPSIVHISRLHGHQVLLQLIEYGHMPLTSSIYDTFFVLQKIVAVQQQGDADALKPAFESLESFVSQTLTALKRHLKQRHDDLENCIKKFTARWENLRKMYLEFFKSYERELLVRIESNLPAFVEELKQLFTLSLATCDSASNPQLDQLADSAAIVEAKLLEFAEFLAVKAARNISIDAYLEDFPGLVHFMYVNRSTGQMLAPDLRQNNPQLLPKTKLWQMVEFTRSYLKKGQTTVMWKDRTFHYSYFLWFEDLSGGILKCSLDLQQHFLSTGFGSASGNGQKSPAEPGALPMDYYSDLVELCFPKLSPGKVRVYELYCIHLGLVTATCAVEHARRLVATISDVVGEETF
ncbi:Hermansky-Pudlak syndrome 1 protein homolog [Drosophila grimshawi]|uniref:GH22790 n=1 Tax=Drosophila grimshawi TaxID=7222 RepID=B4JW80_DROGR|nr:Hermansky-Pudlak syndrome 1 protein homolog [Drosophila grimshawi]EDV98218.1 GH22790 [Drosophila grimshawi]